MSSFPVHGGIFGPRRDEFGLYNRGIFGPPQEEFNAPNQGFFKPKSIELNPVANNPTVPPAPDTIPTSPGMGNRYPDIEAYRDVLRNQPNRKDYELNKWGKLLAGVAGVAEGSQRGVTHGLNVNYGILDRRYNQAVEDWKTRAGGKGELANLEVKLDEINRKREADILDSKAKGLEYYIKVLKLPYEVAKMQVDIDHTKATTADVGGSTHVVDGRLIQSNRLSQSTQPGGVQSITTVGETPPMEEARLRERFVFEEQIRQANRIAVSDNNFQNSAELVTMRGAIEERLRGIATPQDITVASLGATNEIQEMFPELIDQISDVTQDAQGRPIRTPNPNKNPAAWKLYEEAIQEQTQKKLKGDPSPSRVLQADRDLTNAAKEWIKQNYKDNPELADNPEAVQKIKEWINRTMGAQNQVRPMGSRGTTPRSAPPSPSTAPPVVLPPQGAAPQVPFNPALTPGRDMPTGPNPNIPNLGNNLRLPPFQVPQGSARFQVPNIPLQGTQPPLFANPFTSPDTVFGPVPGTETYPPRRGTF